MLRDNPKARQTLYIIAFAAAALALFAPLVPGAIGAALATAFTGLSALATATAATTAIQNLSPAPVKSDYVPGHAASDAVETTVFPQIDDSPHAPTSV
jgi:hypothetical protein